MLVATKDLVIEGRPIAAGQEIPEGTDPERVMRGIELGSIRETEQAEQ